MLIACKKFMWRIHRSCYTDFMNPNQQGYYQPEPSQPVQPAQPALQQPTAAPVTQVQVPPQPVAPTPEGELPVVAEQLPAAEPELYQGDPEQDLEVTNEPVTWSALEYIHQEKNTTWFIIFGVVVAALMGASIFFQQWSFAILIVVIVAVIVVSSRRPPRELAYGLTDEGLSIDGKMHPFENFKAFGVIRDGEEYSVMLIPTQRFQPGVTVYFPEDAGEDIVDMLGSRLPMKDLHLDVVDRVVRLLRL